MATPPSKAEMIEKIKVDWQKLVTLLEKCEPQQMEIPEVQNNWSVKDILAHIARWEQLMTDRIVEAQTGKKGDYPAILDDGDVDKFNADTYQSNKDRPLEEVVEEFYNAHQKSMEVIEPLDEAFITNELPFDWAEGLHVWQLIYYNTYGHYEEHFEALAAWILK